MHYAIADSAGASSATRNNRTSYGNDALDRLVSTTMPGGGTSRYAYDTLGRMTSRHHPDAEGATNYKYDDLGRVRFSQDARQRAAGTGKVTYTVYDTFGRVTRVGEATATFSSLDPESSYAFETDAASWRSRMTYDDGDAAGGDPNYAQGRLVKVEENTDADAAPEVVHEYAYDHLGSVRVKQVTIDGLADNKTVEYVHDLAGRVTRMIYPVGSQARYAYDGAGRLSRVWDAQGNALAAYTHTAAGNIDAHVVGAGISTGRYDYNAREWVTGIDYAAAFNSTLTYDRSGNVTRQVYRHGTAASKTADYAYDDLYRITGFDVSGGISQDYAYDRSGNITSLMTGTSTLTYHYSSSSTPNRLDSTTGAGGESYSYNRNGWMTGKGTVALSYDYRGLTTGYGSTRYLMDPDRRRVKKTVGTAVTYYLRGADGSVLAEYSGQALSAKYVYAGSRRIARVEVSAKRYYLADHLGSTRSLLDEEGTVTAAYDYWPYGKVLASSGTGSTHFRFTGHERDAESNLDYMLARSYAFDIGGFLRPDPMQDAYPGISPYAYAANNPLKYVDPDGRVVFPAVLGLLYAATEVASTGYDAYNLYETIQDPKSTRVDVGMAVVGLGLGTTLPGPGSAYTQAAKTLLKNAEKLVRSVVAGGKRKGLTTPKSYFGSKTQRQAEQALENKFGPPRNSPENQARGNKSFFNEKTKRSYNVHNEPGHGPPHVDMMSRGGNKKKYNLEP